MVIDTIKLIELKADSNGTVKHHRKIIAYQFIYEIPLTIQDLKGCDIPSDWAKYQYENLQADTKHLFIEL